MYSIYSYMNDVPSSGWLISLIFVILTLAGSWKMFAKAGMAGWKSLIPIYNMYLVYKLCWNTMYFWIWFGITVVSAGFGLAYVPVAGIVLAVVSILIQCNCAVRLSLAFGHGAWFGLGLCFFPYIFTMILGFGSSRYQY